VSGSIYTLLIVESPVLARLIQKVAPSSVYVMATGGYCWTPEYDVHQNRLKAVANPDQAAFRKELREQAKWAGNIVIASDMDASGDFIAWSISRFLKTSLLMRGQIRHVSKRGIVQSLSETSELNETFLENRLRNRFLIRQVWQQTRALPDMDIAAISAIFSKNIPFQSFLDESGNEYKSSRPVEGTPGEWFPVRPDSSLNEFRNHKPLSTFDVVELAVRKNIASTYPGAESLLFELFQHKLHLTDESLISYPRTEANAFYSETWESIYQRYLNAGLRQVFKPTFLRETADRDEPHESIYPLRIDLLPEQVKGELSGSLGSLYELIHTRTLQAVTMPETLAKILTNQFLGDVFFYPSVDGLEPNAESLRPVCTVTEFGNRLCKLGLITPSSFGSKLEEWEKNGFISIQNAVVQPGKRVLPHLENSDSYLLLFNKLATALSSDLNPETVRQILTS
jgi:hypothetical protein